MISESRASLFEGAVNALPFSVLAVDGAATIVYGNDAWRRSATALQVRLPDTGIGHAYIPVLDSVLSVKPSDREQVERGLADVLAQRVLAFEHETPVWLRGVRRWFRVVITGAAGQSGALIQHLETTETHRQLEARVDALAHFKAVFETAIDGIVIFTDDLRFVNGNPAVERMLGRPQDELYDRRLTNVLNAEQAENVRAQHAELLRTGSQRGIFSVTRPDGSVIDLEYVARANFVPGRHVAQLRDITAARQMEGQLRQAQKLQAIGQLAGGIAHDFNNLLTVVVGHADYLLDDVSRLSDDARESMQEILRASHRGADMVRKLTAFSRQERLRLEPVQLESLVLEVTSLLRRLVPETVAVLYSAAPDVPAALVDAAAVQQILFNLATNARDAMPSHGGALRFEVQSHPDHVTLTVSDTGLGMSEETRARIFEPFFTTKAVGEGTGLGMSMVYGLMEQMHGQILVASRPGEGTQVTMHFPLVRQTREDGTARDANDAGTPRKTADTTGEDVLLVEDDDAIRALATRILQRGGYQVTEAGDGDVAARCLHDRKISGATPFALVVSDVVMPNGGGARVFDALNENALPTRLLWVTGYAGDETGDWRMRAPSDAPVLQKPWTATQLLTAVRSAIDADRVATSASS